jgi:hypothetical protein
LLICFSIARFLNCLVRFSSSRVRESRIMVLLF